MRFFTLVMMLLVLSFVICGSVVAQPPDGGVIYQPDGSVIYQMDPNANMPGENLAPGGWGSGGSAPEPATFVSLVSLGVGLGCWGLYRWWRKS